MATPFIGEIKMFAGNFAPVHYALCNGQLLSIAQNTALFSLLGTTYGGDGITTFGLPDLRGRIPIHQGQGPGLSPYVMGEITGTENVTLTGAQLPSHTHPARAGAENGTQASPLNNLWAASVLNEYAAAANLASLNASAIGQAGNSLPHDNMMPSLVVTFIIALFGVFPSRN